MGASLRKAQLDETTREFLDRLHREISVYLDGKRAPGKRRAAEPKPGRVVSISLVGGPKKKIERREAAQGTPKPRFEFTEGEPLRLQASTRDEI